MFDVFVAPLRCPGCGADTAEAEIQTHIRGASADGSALRVGSEINPYHLTPESIVESGYALVNEPEPGEPIRLLDVWTCPGCRQEQWAVVEILDGRIVAVEAVTLDRATLASANYISEIEAELLADSIGRDEGATSVEVLRRRLPA